jgi:hypothetical protein
VLISVFWPSSVPFVRLAQPFESHDAAIAGSRSCISAKPEQHKVWFQIAPSEKSSIQNFTLRALVNIDQLAGSVGCSEVPPEIPARLDHLPLPRFHGKNPDAAVIISGGDRAAGGIARLTRPAGSAAVAAVASRGPAWSCL